MDATSPNLMCHLGMRKPWNAWCATEERIGSMEERSLAHFAWVFGTKTFREHCTQSAHSWVAQRGCGQRLGRQRLQTRHA
eukprot:gene11278-biopygen1122